jgi:hypothetical protein
MGKYARALCSTLASAYGAPGTTLRPPERLLTTAAANFTPQLLAAIQSWRYSTAVTQLAVPTQATNPYRIKPKLSEIHGPGCLMLVNALPHLAALSCDAVFPGSDASLNESCTRTIIPHTALATLNLRRSPLKLHTISLFAPNLRSLTIRSCVAFQATHSLWQAVALLRSLRHLDLGAVQNNHLDTPSFYTAVRQLTALTHLGLALLHLAPDEVMATESSHRFCRALCSLPLLTSFKIINFRSVGEWLGAALVVLQLECLELGEAFFTDNDWQQFEYDAPAIPSGCLPTISAMPSLRQLTLNLAAARFIPREVQLMSWAGSTTLRAISFTGLNQYGGDAAFEILAECPALTRITFGLEDVERVEEITSMEDPHLLNDCLAQHTLLQHLELDGPMCHMTSLTCLTALTCLSTDTYQYTNSRQGVAPERNLQLIGSISSLRKLAIKDSHDARWRRLCLEAVLQLPLLEDLQLLASSWTEEELQMLLPPPALLRKLRIGRCGSQDAVAWVREVDEQFQSYGIDVEINIGF